MKRPYLHEQKKLKPNFVYAARCMFDITDRLGSKSKVFYTKLKSGVFLVRYL